MPPLDNTMSLIEAMLFVSDAPLALDQFKRVLGSLETTQIRKMLEDLNSEYEQSNRGIRIVEVAGGFRMVTPQALSPFLKKLYKEKRVERLSKPALETLAIIAYKQPVTRLEVESLRNVNVDHLISSLTEKEFIHIVGVKKAPGNPKVYGTTKQFLEYFGLKSLDDLPKMEDFSRMAQEQAAKEQQEQHQRIGAHNDPTESASPN